MNSFGDSGNGDNSDDDGKETLRKTKNQQDEKHHNADETIESKSDDSGLVDDFTPPNILPHQNSSQGSFSSIANSNSSTCRSRAVSSQLSESPLVLGLKRRQAKVNSSGKKKNDRNVNYSKNENENEISLEQESGEQPFRRGENHEMDTLLTPENKTGKAIETEKDAAAARENESSSSSSEKSIVSILNLVVDYAMKSPSPLEPDEFQWAMQRQRRKRQQQERLKEMERNVQGSSSFQINQFGGADMASEGFDDDEEEGFATDHVQVPVIRIFGPIIRGQALTIKNQKQNDDNDAGTPSEEEQKEQNEDESRKEKIYQHQSGCLHIHGAYPYMLARPIDAGPDGSSDFFKACRDTVAGKSVNDNDESNEDESSDDSHDQENYTSNTDWDDEDSVKLIVDDVHYKLESALKSMMEGRASYNDDAPSKTDSVPPREQERFIRQITVVCGRGFYTYCNGTVAPFLRIEYYNPSHRWRVKILLERGFDMPLEYHPSSCFSGIATAARNRSHHEDNRNENEDLSLLRFRCYEAHIPYTMQFFKDHNLAGMSWIKVGDGRFRKNSRKNPKDRKRRSTYELLQEDIPIQLNWNEQAKTNAKDGIGSANEDIEHSNNDVGDEFWTRKETSCNIEMDTTVINLLNIMDVMKTIPQREVNGEAGGEIHWRAVPSLREIWAEERLRMAHLLPPKDNFLSASSQSSENIATPEEKKSATLPFTLSVKKGSARPGAKLALQGVKRLFDSSPMLEEQFQRALADIVGKYDTILDNIDSKLQKLYTQTRERKMRLEQNLKGSDGGYLGLSQDEAFSALETLIEQFTTPKKSQNVESPSKNPLMLSDHFSLSQKITPSQKFHVLSQNATQSLGLSQSELQEVEDDLEFCMNQELGVIEEGSNIDASTLAPYEDSDDTDFLQEEVDMAEADFERCLTNLATQDPSPELLCAPSKSRSDESEAECYNSSTSSPPSTTPLREQSKSDDNYEIDQDEIDSSESRHLLGQGSITPEVYQSDSLPPALSIVDIDAVSKEKTSMNMCLSSTSASSSMKGSGNVLELKRSPPTREKCDPNTNTEPTSAVLWHPIMRERELSVNWLGFPSTTLPKDKSSFVDQSFIEPVRRPPSFSRVRRWIVKKRNRHQIAAHNQEKAQIKLKRKQDDLNRGNNDEVEKDGLEFDQNTRKLKPKNEKKRKKRVAFADSVQITSCTMHEIEEVQYQDLSQDLSQASDNSLSQEVKSDEKRNETKVAPPESVKRNQMTVSQASLSIAHTHDTDEGSSEQADPLDGIGQQGGKLYIEGAGGLKTSSMTQTSTNYHPPSEVKIMSIEVHVQTRTGRATTHDSSSQISMKPDSSRDAIFAVCYVYAVDPGGGEQILIKERGCIFVPTQNEIQSYQSESEDNLGISKIISKVGKTMGCASELKIEAIDSEKKLLLRIAALVQFKDPDTLMSWDTQSAGLGYLIDRGLAAGDSEKAIDMIRLLGRTPKHDKSRSEKKLLSDWNKTDESKAEDSGKKFEGSVLGADWDDRVGAGAGPSSIIGRLIMNCWKIMSDEVKHPNASYQPAMVSTVLKKRLPFHDDLTLGKWYGGHKGLQRWRVLKYRILQAQANILLFDALDVIGRAGEAARLSGVELSQSFPGIRGSQYKVEGVLLRALQSLWSDERGEKRGKQHPGHSLSANSEGSFSQSQSPWKVRRNKDGSNGGKPSATEAVHSGYFFYSPSKQDCSKQEALECQAMTLEPQSGFHFDPIVVCDFTALYPSLVIAYNLCYSTCAGKLEYHSTRNEMRQKGRTTQKLGPFRYDEVHTAYVLKQHMKSLQMKKIKESKSSDRAYCVPTGSLFVSEDVLKGVLPSVLDEMLATRAMLKKASKEYKKGLSKPPVAVLRQLEARQLALKYVANVTYGYTSATFSGRSAMPLLADAIVECGRRTLSNAIMLANKWGQDEKGPWKGATVVYGDTDSVFIKLPGRSVKEAFKFGRAFCDAVTASNPPPVQLKLEKVYLGTLLQTKKKYCGMKFDSPDQKVPSFEAKGIETIRKDQCALTQKILRNALISIFKGGNIENLREYLIRQWSLISAGRLPVSDFILTGRVRSHYRGKVGPVQAALARRLAEADPGRKILHKERLPYVIVAAPGRSFKLRDCVLTPNELLSQWDSFTIHSEYYATKHVNAALNRCFSLSPFNVDVNNWYESAPKPRKRIHHWPVARRGNSSMISAYFGSDVCSLCGQKSKSDGSTKSVICAFCQRDKSTAAFLALKALNQIQQKAHRVAMTCRSCNGTQENAGTFAIETMRIQEKRTLLTSSRSTTKTILTSNGISSPLSTCICIDCPITYKRHEMRESEIEALALCNALDLF